MLFWLTFLQSLPTIEIQKTDLITSNIETTPAYLQAQISPLTPRTNQPIIGQLGGSLTLFAGFFTGIVVLMILATVAYSRLYKVTPANEAFVKTGGVLRKRRTVIKHGGSLVLPVFDRLTRVPLKEISIDVERTGKLAVRTQDYLRADMRVTFFVCINAIDEDIKTATERLSQNGQITTDDIKNAIEKRADDAIRAAAKSKTLAYLDSDKLGFAQEVLNLIEPDLKKIGLTLNNIAISEIEESDTYDTNNFFDAQGVKLRTETIQKSIKQKEEVELTTERERREFALTTQVEIDQKKLVARKQSLEIEKDKESAELAQQLEVETLRAQQTREIQEAKDKEAANQERHQILQAKAVEEEEIRKKLAVQQSQIIADITLEEQQKKLKVAQALQKQEAEMAEIQRQKTIDSNRFSAQVEVEEQEKKLKVAQALQKQEAEMAEIQRQKTIESNRLTAQVEVAEAERLSQLAKQEAAIAIAAKEQERLIAEAERAKAESGVTTATEIEKAERQQRLSVIIAQQEAERQRITEQNVVEIDVFRRKRQAEIARQAADLEAESIRTLADANRDKDLAEADGLEAKVKAENAISDANRIAQVISELGPQMIDNLPEIMTALAPQPGVLGDAKIYAFPGANGNSSTQEISKLMMSTSGMTLVNSLLEDGKLVSLLAGLTQLMRGSGGTLPQELEQFTESVVSKESEPTKNKTNNTQKSDNSVSPPSVG
ncbi:SPFH domain / Band 7 family protein [Lyngbya aestuarii BL J]|uniref:SPFH domain / Band 7 family protein n=2 Tax=Lyngbya aestuarii TaxID=118322 RepID=U7QBX1_9CYAN|nr:SPFH domain-containing protein [Lyngbya aestuarii]ERT05323.1 SPFH domain / Band 7 family protein [Lyngbya aestuarii BL J]